MFSILYSFLIILIPLQYTPIKMHCYLHWLSITNDTVCNWICILQISKCFPCSILQFYSIYRSNHISQTKTCFLVWITRIISYFSHYLDIVWALSPSCFLHIIVPDVEPAQKVWKISTPHSTLSTQFHTVPHFPIRLLPLIIKHLPKHHSYWHNLCNYLCVSVKLP